MQGLFFFVEALDGFVEVRGADVLVGDKVVWSDTAPLAAAAVVGPATLLVGGEGKKVVALELAKGGGARHVFSETVARKTSFLRFLSSEEALVVDSAGAVRGLAWRREPPVWRELFAHFSPVTAVLVLQGRRVVTADADGQVRVTGLERPREAERFLLGNEGTVVHLERGRHDLQVACATREGRVRFFEVGPAGSNLEVRPFEGVEEIVSTKSRKLGPQTTKKTKTEDE